MQLGRVLLAIFLLYCLLTVEAANIRTVRRVKGKRQEGNLVRPVIIDVKTSDPEAVETTNKVLKVLNSQPPAAILPKKGAASDLLDDEDDEENQDHEKDATDEEKRVDAAAKQGK